MLFLMFHAGDDRYAIDASQAIEVLPLLQWKRVPHSRPGLAGMFNYHGAPVALIDLTELITNKPSRAWMNTRIIVIRRKGSGERSDIDRIAGRAGDGNPATARRGLSFCHLPEDQGRISGTGRHPRIGNHSDHRRRRSFSRRYSKAKSGKRTNRKHATSRNRATARSKHRVGFEFHWNLRGRSGSSRTDEDLARTVHRIVLGLTFKIHPPSCRN